MPEPSARWWSGSGVVDPGLVRPVLDGRCRFVADPTDADLAQAAGRDRPGRRQSWTPASSTGLPRLRVIARTGVGVETVDLAAATARGIAVVITPGTGTVAVAEGAIAMAMHLVEAVRPADRRWSATVGGPTAASVPVGDLAGATLGVVGYGRIGQQRRQRSAPRWA